MCESANHFVTPTLVALSSPYAFTQYTVECPTYAQFVDPEAFLISEQLCKSKHSSIFVTCGNILAPGPLFLFSLIWKSLSCNGASVTNLKKNGSSRSNDSRYIA